MITVDEQISGWYTALRRAKTPERVSQTYDRLARTVVFVSQFPILSFSLEAISEYDRLLRSKLGVRANDLRIAAIDLTNDDTLVTRNVADFLRVPGLRVENWADGRNCDRLQNFRRAGRRQPPDVQGGSKTFSENQTGPGTNAARLADFCAACDTFTESP